MTGIQRRDAMLLIAASTATVAGCNSRAIENTVAATETDTLQSTRVGLRGFQLVAFTVGKRLVQLPHPAVRILGIALVTSGVATFLAIEYLDVELKKRSVREALDEYERSEVEAALAVTFQTENGFDESVALGPNQYEPS